MHAHLPSPDRRDEGFTLVEMLIVIVILGVLSTVTVFAVNGIASRGETAATSADEQTVVRAQEAYYALYDTFGTEAELLAEGLLNRESSTHDITLINDGEDYSLVAQGAGGSVTTTPGPAPNTMLTHSITFAGFQASASSTNTALPTIVAVNDVANRAMFQTFLDDNPTLSSACRIVYVEDPALDTVDELVALIDSAPHIFAVSRQSLVTHSNGSLMAFDVAYMVFGGNALMSSWASPFNLQSLYDSTC